MSQWRVPAVLGTTSIAILRGEVEPTGIRRNHRNGPPVPWEPMSNSIRHGCGYVVAQGDELSFSPSSDWLCPGCGENGGDFDAHFHAGTIGLSTSATAVASNGVGREIQVLDTKDEQLNQLINEVQYFAETLTRGPGDASLLDFGLQTPIGQRIVDEFVSSASTGLAGTYFRGRWLFEDEVAPGEFMRPPTQQRPGRYNLDGDNVLYLACSRDVVLDELRERDKGDGKSLYIEEFDLRLDDVRVASVHGQNLQSALDALLFFSESFPIDSSDDPSSYRPSQFLRLVADHHGIDAVVYPSVRAGFPGASSLNLVVFGSAAGHAEGMMTGSATS